MKNFTSIVIAASLVLMVAFSAFSQDVFKVANVGIGTVNPAQRLDVAGSIKFSWALMPNGVAGVAGNILLSGGPGTFPTWLANGTSGQVLEANGSGIPTWTTLSTSTAWLLNGNSGTTPGTNYLGTSDGASFQFDVNGQYAGSLDPLNSGYSNANVYLGAPSTSAPILGGAGNSDAGQNNVGIGLAALGSALGKNLTTNTGYGNTSNLLAAYDVAIGAYSLSSLQYGSVSTAVGAYSQRYANFSGAAVSVGGALMGGNSAVGAYSLYSNSTGQFNTAIGYYSMYGSGSATAVGNFNTAEGYQSLYTAAANIYSNTAIGSNSLYNNTGNRNTAVGDSALYTNTSGFNNTALGYQANVGANNLTNAIAIGYQATAPVSNSIALGNSSVSSLYLPGYTTVGDLLYTSAASGLVSSLTPGVAGTVLASSGPGVAPTWLSTSGVNVVSGTPPIYITGTSPSPIVNIQGLPSGIDAGGVLYSTGAGSSALFTSTGTSGYILQSNGTSAPSWIANAASAGGAWMLTGNTLSGTYGTNFIGSGSSGHPIEFVANGIYQGMIDPSASNFYFGQGTGSDSLAYLTSSIGQNVAIGYEAFVSPLSTTGQNAAIGAEALHYDQGNDNDAVGAYALHNNTTGADNDALGYGAGFNNTTGSFDVNVGFEAGYNQTTGSYNLAAGDSALYGGGGTGGTPATYVGSYNTAVGVSALAGIGTGTNGGTGGFYNTALGYDAAIHTTTGNYNTAVGYQAGTANTTGIENTLVGYQANVSSNNLTNATAIGYQAIAPASNSVTLGNSSALLYLPGYSGAGEVGDILYTSAASGLVGTLTPGNSGYVLESQGVGSPPTWLAVVAPNTVTGTQPIYITGAPATPVVNIQGLANGSDQGGVLYSTGAGSSAQFTPTGTSGFYLISNGTSAPSWGVLSPNGAWSLVGNAVSATYGTNYLGSTNDYPLQFKANGAFAGVIDPTNSNIFFGNGAGPAGYTSEAGVAATPNLMVGIGWGALGSAVSGATEHVAIGYNALHTLTSGATPCVAVGAYALYKATGVPNDALGFQAGYNLSTGIDNLMAGYDAGYYNQTGDYDIAVGDSSMYGGYPATGVGALYTGSFYNTAIGVSALAQITTPATASTGYNTAVGYEADLHNTTGEYNTGVGVQANYSNQKGWNNVAAGYGALYKNTYSGNTAIGTNALYNNNIGSWISPNFNGPNTAVGDSAMYANVLGTKNVAVGYAALTSAGVTLAGGSGNTAVGFMAMESANGAAVANDVAIGNQALLNYNQQSNNVAVGAFAMYGGTSANSPAIPAQDVAIGAFAMYSAGNTITGSTAASYNIAIGSATSYTLGTLYDVTTGTGNVAIGYESGTATSPITTGSYNTLLGYLSYTTVGTASQNVAIGYDAHYGGTASANDANTAIGYNSAATGSANSTAIGEGASASNTNATAIGAAAAASGTSSTAIGASASASQTNSTAIGPSATATGAPNTVILGSTSVAISVGIGTTTPARTLEVAGTGNTIRVDGLGAGNSFATTSPNATSDQIVFARSTGDLYSMPNTASGYVLTNVSGVPTWAAASGAISATVPLYASGSNVYISSTSGGNGGVLYGTGTGAAFTPPSPSTGYVLEGQGPGNAPIWVTLASLAGSGDNWGTQSAVTDSFATNVPPPTENTLTGNGLPSSPLKLAKDNATTGQVLEWNGTTWLPTTATTTSSIVNGGVNSVVVVTNGTNQVVGNGNAVVDIQGTAGGVVYGTGPGTSAAFTAAGTSGYVLTSAGAGAPTWATAGAGNYWGLSGNSGTVPGTNFLGTTDDEGLVFKVNNTYAGSLDPLNTNYSAANVYLGAASTSAPVLPGAGNIDAGDNNVAIGLSAMASAGGPSYTGNGSNSTVGYISGNVAVGVYALSSDVFGAANTAVGAYSQRFFTNASVETSGYNTSVGAYALYSNSNGWYNTAVGDYSMYGPGSSTATGYDNTANGYKSLYSITTGGSNTAIGSNAAYKTTGGRNSALGDSALVSNTTGEYNSALGYDADVSSGTLTNATAIGAYAQAAQSNSMVLGSISGVNGATANTNVCIGTNSPASDAAIAIATNHLETVTAGTLSEGSLGPGVTAGAVTGTDVGGVVTFTPPANQISGNQVTVTFGVNYTTFPTVIITPSNAATGAITNVYQPYVTATTTGFTISFGTGGTAASSSMSFNYFVIETQ